MTEFSKNLVAYRKAAGYSQKAFAELLDIPVTTLSGYENAGHEPKFEILIKIAKIFGVPVDDLLTESADDLISESNEDKIKFSMCNNILTVKIPDEFKDTIIYTLPVAVKILQELNQRALEVAKTNEPATLSWEIKPHTENSDVINDSVAERG